MITVDKWKDFATKGIALVAVTDTTGDGFTFFEMKITLVTVLENTDNIDNFPSLNIYLISERLKINEFRFIYKCSVY